MWFYLIDLLECSIHDIKGCRMGRSDKVSLWYVALLINTWFRIFLISE